MPTPPSLSPLEPRRRRPARPGPVLPRWACSARGRGLRDDAWGWRGGRCRCRCRYRSRGRTAMGPKRSKSDRESLVPGLPSWEPALVSARLEEVKAADGQSRRRGGKGGSGLEETRTAPRPGDRGCRGAPRRSGVALGRAVSGPDVRWSPLPLCPLPPSVALRVSLLLLTSTLSFLGSGCQVSARSELFINC